jgi:hypothetical protein
MKYYITIMMLFSLTKNSLAIPIINLPNYNNNNTQQVQQNSQYWTNDYSCGVRPNAPPYCYGNGAYYCQCNNGYCQWILVGC